MAYTERRSTVTKYQVVNLPDWVPPKRGRTSLTLDTELKLVLKKYIVFQDVHYQYNERVGGLQPYPQKPGMSATDERVTVTVPAGSRVEYIKGDSSVVCYIAGILDQHGREAQLAFDKCPHNGYSARITRYS